MGKNFVLEREELKLLIKEALEECFDPDYGLEIRPELFELLKQSSKEKEEGRGISLKEAREFLGL